MTSTVQVSRVKVTLTAPSTVQVSRAQVVAGYVPSTVQVSQVRVSAARPAEPFDTVLLPSGSWTQTAGTSVTITSGAFPAPATVAGDILQFTAAGKAAAYQALPHTLWLWNGAALVALKL